MEERLNSGGATIDEEFIVKSRELIVDGKSLVILTFKAEAHHASILSGEGIADHRDDTLSAECNQRIGESVIARDDLEIIGLMVDDLFDLLEIA